MLMPVALFFPSTGIGLHFRADIRAGFGEAAARTMGAYSTVFKPALLRWFMRPRVWPQSKLIFCFITTAPAPTGPNTRVHSWLPIGIYSGPPSQLKLLKALRVCWNTKLSVHSSCSHWKASDKEKHSLLSKDIDSLSILRNNSTSVAMEDGGHRKRHVLLITQFCSLKGNARFLA